MIHIITNHHKTDMWIDLQISQIKKHISEYLVWSYSSGFDISKHQKKFHYLKNHTPRTGEAFGGYLNHMLKLNSLTEIVLNDTNTKEDDILIWLDSDAFPIANINNYIDNKLSVFPLIAIVRPENGGDIIPHPSFTCSTVAFWKKNKLNWNGIPGKDTAINNFGLHDPGGELYETLRKKNINWFRLKRTKSLTEHQVFFTIYDNIIYHHGAGSRAKPCCRGGNFGVNFDSVKMYEKICDQINKNLL